MGVLERDGETQSSCGTGTTLSPCGALERGRLRELDFGRRRPNRILYSEIELSGQTGDRESFAASECHLAFHPVRNNRLVTQR
jgi:hypothetical protein